MYQASSDLVSQDALVSGGLKIVPLVAGGAHGCGLKSCVPSSTYYADSFGYTLEVRSMLRESCACLTR